MLITPCNNVYLIRTEHTILCTSESVSFLTFAISFSLVDLQVFATPQQPMTTPMMTPSYSYTTPGQQQTMSTPQYPSSTPQSSHSHHQHPSSTPSSSSSSSRVRTPQPKWVNLISLTPYECLKIDFWCLGCYFGLFFQTNLSHSCGLG